MLGVRINLKNSSRTRSRTLFVRVRSPNSLPPRPVREHGCSRTCSRTFVREPYFANNNQHSSTYFLSLPPPKPQKCALSLSPENKTMCVKATVLGLILGLTTHRVPLLRSNRHRLKHFRTDQSDPHTGTHACAHRPTLLQPVGGLDAWRSVLHCLEHLTTRL